MDQKVAQHNKDAEERAVASLRKLIRTVQQNNEFFYGQVGISLFYQGGLIHNSEATIRENERFLKGNVSPAQA